MPGDSSNNSNSNSNSNNASDSGDVGAGAVSGSGQDISPLSPPSFLSQIPLTTNNLLAQASKSLGDANGIGGGGIGGNGSGGQNAFVDMKTATPTLTLVQTQASFREAVRWLTKLRFRLHSVRSVMLITKPGDAKLIGLTREMALWLMYAPFGAFGAGTNNLIVPPNKHPSSSAPGSSAPVSAAPTTAAGSPVPPRILSSLSIAGLGSAESTRQSSFAGNGSRGIIVYVDEALRDNPRFGLSKILAEHPRAADQLRFWNADLCRNKPEQFEMVFTLGGDGTVLFASWLFQTIVPITIPFHLGSLGFLTMFEYANFRERLMDMSQNGVRVSLRMRFSCTVYRWLGRNNGSSKSGRRIKSKPKSKPKSQNNIIDSDNDDNEEEEELADIHQEEECFDIKQNQQLQSQLQREGVDNPPTTIWRGDKAEYERLQTIMVLNEVVVDRGPSPYMSSLELFGDGRHLTTVQADGLCVATPTGSTAYSLSAGGPLVHPDVPAIAITPICPHTLSFRPMLLPDTMALRVCVPRRSRSTAWASFDGRNRIELRRGDNILIKASQYPFPTVVGAGSQTADWFGSLSRCLHWNERKSQKSFDDDDDDDDDDDGNSSDTDGSEKNGSHLDLSRLNRMRTNGVGRASSTNQYNALNIDQHNRNKDARYPADSINNSDDSDGSDAGNGTASSADSVSKCRGGRVNKKTDSQFSESYSCSDDDDDNANSENDDDDILTMSTSKMSLSNGTSNDGVSNGGRRRAATESSEHIMVSRSRM